jgi:multidrug resistance efflux pump
MNRTVIIIILVALLIVAGLILFGMADISMSNPWLDGQKEKAIRGDLVIPVTATGVVEPAKLIQIKSKASGQVTKIHVVEGQIVNAGDILVELDPVDEKRNVEARRAALNRTKSGLEKAKVSLENYQLDLPLQTKLADARLKDAEARLYDAKYKWDKMQGYLESDVAAKVEGVTVQTTYEAALAAKQVAEAEVQRAKNNETILIRSAREDVRQAEEALVEAQKAMDEAELRLEETTVRAKSTGMVYSITVREGEMIQSGTASFTGGTTLMILADTGSMFVMAQIDEADIGAIRQIAPSYAKPGHTEKLAEDVYREKAMAIVDSFNDDDAAEGEEGQTAEGDGESAEEPLDPEIQKIADEITGTPVDVTVEAYRNEQYQGVIERILPEPQRVNNAVAFRVRIRLVGKDLEKLMGLQADLSFTTDKKEDVVLVKNEALHSEGRNCFVYVPVPEQPRDEEKRPVEIGMTDGTYTEIVSGLSDDEYVFTRRPQKTQKEKEAAS